MKWMRIVAILFVLGIVWLIVRQVARVVYFEEREQLAQQIETAQGALSTIRTAYREQYPPVRDDLDAIVEYTLGPSGEIVEAELRARLNQMVAAIGIVGPSVSTGRNAAQSSPARRRMRRDNPLKDTPDFVEQQATVTGLGTFEQAMRLVDAIERAPWIKRIDSIDLDPKQSPEQLSISVRLTTIYVPGRAPDADSAAPLGAPSQYARVASFVGARPFELPAALVQDTTPAPPEVLTQDTDPVTPAAPAFAYSDWRITGVVQGTQGMEVWLLHARSSKSRTLAVGDSIGPAKFEAATDEEAEFSIGDARFMIRVGSTLNDRVALEPGRDSI